MTSNLGSRDIQSATENPLADRDIKTDVYKSCEIISNPSF